MTGAAACSAFAGAKTLLVNVSPSIVDGYGATGALANISTGAVLAAAVGAIGAVAYAWVRRDTSAYTWTIASAAAASTTFTAQNVENGVVTQAIFEVTATDSVGNTGKALVTANARNNTTRDPPERRDTGTL